MEYHNLTEDQRNNLILMINAATSNNPLFLLRIAGNAGIFPKDIREIHNKLMQMYHAQALIWMEQVFNKFKDDPLFSKMIEGKQDERV